MNAVDALTEDEWNRLCASTLTSENPERDKCIFMIGGKGGLRPGEIALITWDVVLDSKLKLKKKKFSLPSVITKGKKKCRTIEFNAELWYAIYQHYLANFTHRKDRMFLTNRGLHFNPHNMHKFISRKCEKAGIHGSGHSLRKKAGTDMYREIHDRGGNIRNVKDWFGHSRVDITERYLAKNRSIIREAAMAI